MITYFSQSVNQSINNWFIKQLTNRNRLHSLQCKNIR